MYIYVYTYMFIYLFICMYMYVCVCIHIYISLSTYIYIYLYVYIYIYTYTNIPLEIQVTTKHDNSTLYITITGNQEMNNTKVPGRAHNTNKAKLKQTRQNNINVNNKHDTTNEPCHE